jgi:glycosyltransferase involved in cell wall biosynthesis
MKNRPLRVLAVATYPLEAASSRYRILQFIAPLRARGVLVDFRPFLTDGVFRTLYVRGRALQNAFAIAVLTLRRLLHLALLVRNDVLFVQREAMLVGPGWFEWFTRHVARKPMLLDLDDATYIRLDSPVYGKWARLLKWPKTDALIRQAGVVVCGNDNIAAHVRAAGSAAVVLPTIVDVDVFRPPARRETRPVPLIGWIGTHSAFAFVEPLLGVLARVAKVHPFRLRIVGSGRDSIDVDGVETEVLPWSLERDIDDFVSLVVGLYPIANDEWASGKSGFKAIQYLSAGVPYVVSPVGIAAQLGEAGRTHLVARTPEEWYAALCELLASPERRQAMGRAAREYALAHFDIERHADELARELRALTATR